MHRRKTVWAIVREGEGEARREKAKRKEPDTGTLVHFQCSREHTAQVRRVIMSAQSVGEWQMVCHFAGNGDDYVDKSINLYQEKCLNTVTFRIILRVISTISVRVMCVRVCVSVLGPNATLLKDENNGYNEIQSIVGLIQSKMLTPFHCSQTIHRRTRVCVCVLECILRKWSRLALYVGED